MRKQHAGIKLSRTSNDRKQLFRNLVVSVVDKGYIVTTAAKARAIKPKVERLVTRAKDNNLTTFRKLMQETGNVKTTKTLMELGSLFAKRPGGYTRIIKLGFSQGDNAPRVRLEWVERLVKADMVVKPELKTETKPTIQAVTPAPVAATQTITAEKPIKTVKKTRAKKTTAQTKTAVKEV
jgi:large subunit ribosomal protein L17